VPDRRSAFDVPDQGDEPVVWDHQRRAFVPVPQAPATPRPTAGPPARSPRPKQWFVGKEAVGKAPPPRDGTPPPGGPRPIGDATTVVPAPAPAAPAAPRPGRYVVPAPERPAVGVAASPAAPAARRPLADPRPRATAPAATPGAPPGPPPGVATARRRRRFLRRPKLRWILLFLTLLPLLLALFGWWYASSKFDEIDRVPVASVLSPEGGGGTNYLLVGSDSREAVTAAGAEDPNVQPGGEAPAGQRSDTMLVLRTTSDGAQLLSIPRDLFVTLPDGDEGRINGAFNDGPQALIQTIQSNLDIPIHRYIEVDFVTFSGLVDALDGITLSAEMVPCPAFDDHSGLSLPTAGPIVVDGQTALAYVRSRHYTQDCGDGPATDPTGDLGRITRQQAFLRTVLADAGASRNPFTLMRIADSVTSGLRIDDGMGLWDAIRFAWDMGKLDPVSVELPTDPFRTSGGAAVLELREPDADAVLARFR
jgi:LCP family protein required for cell wall assembly